MYTNVIHVVIKLKHKDAQNYYFTSDIHNKKETRKQVFVEKINFKIICPPGIDQV